MLANCKFIEYANYDEFNETIPRFQCENCTSYFLCETWDYKYCPYCATELKYE